MNALEHKVGKFKVWQLLAAGGILGLFLYEKNRKAGSVSEAGEGLTASTNNPLAGGNGGGEAGQQPLEPGPPGAPGEPGVPGAEAPAQFTPAQVDAIERSILSANTPLHGAATKPAPVGGKFPHTNAAGQKYRIEKKNGTTFHVYQNGKRVAVGKKRKPAVHHNANHKPSHAAPRAPISHARPTRPKPKPKPVHHRGGWGK